MGYLIMKKTRGRKSHATVPLRRGTNHKVLKAGIGRKKAWQMGEGKVIKCLAFCCPMTILVHFENII